MRKLSFVLWVIALSLVIVAAPAFATGDGAPHPSIYQGVLPTEEVPALEVTEQAPVDEVPVNRVNVLDPDAETTQYVITALLLVIAVLAILVAGSLVALALSAPRWVQSAIVAGYESGKRSAEVFVQRTPGTLDDEALKQADALLEKKVIGILRRNITTTTTPDGGGA